MEEWVSDWSEPSTVFVLGGSYRIETLRHRETGLLIAVSPDYRGLIVTARTPELLAKEAAEGLRILIEANAAAAHDVA